MKKILYLMHVPWGWIKQRPHFLAEHMAKHFDVHVYYRFYKVPFEGRLVANEIPRGLKVSAIPVLPLGRFKPVADLNARIISLTLKSRIKRFDCIWITHPEMFEAVEAILPDDIKVIYDCMDNHLEFPVVKNNHCLCETILDWERRLLDRSFIVFASSNSLKQVLHKRHGAEHEIYVVNNAIFIDDVTDSHPLPTYIDKLFITSGFKLTYIGAINEWFDIALVLETIERFEEITVLLFGPCEVPLPDHPRLIHAGPIEHKDIYEVMERSDGLVMPFLLNELIMGVNPVKLYEYISSSKPAVAVSYPESEQFAEYVHLYTNRNELWTILSDLLAHKITAKKSCAECKAFARNNTWDHRVEDIVNARPDMFDICP